MNLNKFLDYAIYLINDFKIHKFVKKIKKRKINH